jgi:hypothetical protein
MLCVPFPFVLYRRVLGHHWPSARWVCRGLEGHRHRIEHSRLGLLPYTKPAFSAGPGCVVIADLTVRQPFENWTGEEEREGLLNTMCGRSLHCKCRQPNGLNVLRLVRSGDLGPASCLAAVWDVW